MRSTLTKSINDSTVIWEKEKKNIIIVKEWMLTKYLTENYVWRWTLINYEFFTTFMLQFTKHFFNPQLKQFKLVSVFFSIKIENQRLFLSVTSSNKWLDIFHYFVLWLAIEISLISWQQEVKKLNGKSKHSALIQYTYTATSDFCTFSHF